MIRKLCVLALLIGVVVIVSTPVTRGTRPARPAGAGGGVQVGGPFDLSWAVIAGGGGTFSTGGSDSLGGTAGQPAAAMLSGGNYALQSGFWAAEGGGISPTATAVPSNTATSTGTPTRTATSTVVPSNTPTSTAVPSNTSTSTAVPTNRATNTPTNTAVPSNTPTSTGIPTNPATSTAVASSTATRTAVSTSTATNTAVPTNTATSTGTPTNTPTSTAVPTRTPTPGSAALLIGHVTWQGRPAQPDPLQQLPLTLTLQLGGAHTNYPNLTTDARGFFTVTVTTLPHGLYAWWVKGPQFLATAGTVTLNGAPTTAQEMGLQRTGDVNNDNLVDVTDFSLLRASFGKSCGDPNFNPSADLDGSCVVDITDFSLLRGNFGQSGAPPQSGPQQSKKDTRPAGQAYLELRSQGKAPRNGGSAQVGERFVLELWLVPAAGQPVTAQQSYLTFPAGLLQHVRQSAAGGSWVASSRVLADTSGLDLELQNQVCNGPGACTFGPLAAPAGSIAFASGAWARAPVDTPVRLAQIGLVALAPGEARIHWQTAPTAPANRTSLVIGGNQAQPSEPGPFSDYVLKIVKGP